MKEDISLGRLLKEITYGKKVGDVEVVKELLDNTINLRELAEEIYIFFEPKEFPPLAQILTKALDQLEALVLVEELKAEEDSNGSQLARILEECLA